MRGRPTVVACSALKRAYRDRLRAAAGPALTFVYLAADPEAMRRRVGGRKNHYMPASLVDSQFAALEPPRDEPGVIEVSADAKLDVMIPLARRASRRPGSQRGTLTWSTTLSVSVAIVGVGVMGGAIATRLLDTGATVIVFDRDDSKTRALTEKGARAVSLGRRCGARSALRHHQPQFGEDRRIRGVRARGRSERRERRYPADRHVVD